MNSQLRFLLAATAVAGALSVSGCANKASLSVEQLATPPATADQKLLADLQQLPPAARPDYLQKHQDVAQALAQSKDPAVKTGFAQAMRGIQ